MSLCVFVHFCSILTHANNHFPPYSHPCTREHTYNSVTDKWVTLDPLKHGEPASLLSHSFTDASPSISELICPSLERWTERWSRDLPQIAWTHPSVQSLFHPTALFLNAPPSTLLSPLLMLLVCHFFPSSASALCLTFCAVASLCGEMQLCKNRSATHCRSSCVTLSWWTNNLEKPVTAGEILGSAVWCSW